MYKIARIIINGETYIVFRDPSVEGKMKQNGFGHVLRRLILTESDEKAIGCIVFYVELLTFYGWKTNEETMYGFSETLEYALANLLAYLPLGIDHIKETFSRSQQCLSVEFSKKQDGFSEDKNTYSIQLKNSFFKTAQRIVFKDAISKKRKRQEILQILLNEFEENSTFMRIENLQSSIPITTKEFLFHLRLLKEEDRVDFITQPSDPEKIVSVRIKAKGIRELENGIDTQLQSSQMVKNIYGPNIENLTTYGDNSPISVTVSDINTAFVNILKQIEEKEFENKKEVLGLVKELQDELGDNKDPKEVKGIMEKIKSKTVWAYNLILKNPVITTFLTQLLLKKVGL